MHILDFLDRKERKIILANKVSACNGMLRNINIKQGKTVFDVSVLKVEDLAKEIVVAYEAASETEEKNSDIINDTVAKALLRNVLVNNDYKYFPKEITTDATVAEVYKCINELRLNAKTSLYEEAIDEKVNEIKKIISDYEAYLIKKNTLDKALLVETAIKIASENKSKVSFYLPKFKNVFVGDLETNKWSDKEREFISIITDDNYAKIEFLFDKINDEIEFEYVRAYGIANEIKHVVSEIKRGNIQSKSAIYYSTPVYVNFIKAALDNALISYKITAGETAAQTDFMQFIFAALRCASNDFLFTDFKDVSLNNKTTFYNVASADTRFVNPSRGYYEAEGKGIGWGYERYVDYAIRTIEKSNEILGNDDEVEMVKDKAYANKVYAEFLLDYIDVFYNLNDDSITEDKWEGRTIIIDEVKERGIKDIAERLIKFARLYTYKSNSEYKKLKEPLVDMLKLFAYVSDDTLTVSDKADYISDAFSTLNISSDAKEDSVVVSQINGFNVIERENVYIVGLDAASFTHDTKQSPVLLDEEKRMYIEGASGENINVPLDLSDMRNKLRKEDMINFFRTMYGGKVCMLYNGFDTVSLRECSPSVFFLNMVADNEVKIAEGYLSDCETLDNNIGKDDGNIDINQQELFSKVKVIKEKLDAIKAEKKAKSESKKKEIVHDNEDTDSSGTEDDYVNSLDADSDEENAKLEGEEQGTDKKMATRMSATSLHTYLNCPLIYYFQYEKYLNNEDGFEKNGYEWLPASAKGNLCHHVMEKYFNELLENEQVKSLPANMNEELFEKLFNAEVVEQEKLIPCSSKAIKAKEIENYHELMKTYITRIHSKWQEPTEKVYENLYCELAFENLEVGGEDYKLLFKGSIDRVDGYVDENEILNIRIVDYKTGRKDKKQKEVESGTQHQHIVYAIAALHHFRTLLEKDGFTFRGKKVKDICFKQIAYVFPYAEDDGTELYDVYDVTKEALEYVTYTDEKKSLLNAKILLPTDVMKTISRVIGATQNNDLEKAQKERSTIVDERIAAILESKKIEENAKRLEEGKEPYTEEELANKVSYGLSDFCQDNYCKYKEICRKWMKGYEITEEE